MPYRAQVKRIEVTTEQHRQNLRWVTDVGSIEAVDVTAILRNNHRRVITLSGRSTFPIEVYRSWAANDAVEGVDDDQLEMDARVYSALLTEMLDERPLFV